jgi:hypothetical protein
MRLGRQGCLATTMWVLIKEHLAVLHKCNLGYPAQEVMFLGYKGVRSHCWSRPLGFPFRISPETVWRFVAWRIKRLFLGPHVWASEKSVNCKTGSVLKGLNRKYDFSRIRYFRRWLACPRPLVAENEFPFSPFCTYMYTCITRSQGPKFDWRPYFIFLLLARLLVVRLTRNQVQMKGN